MVRYRINFGAWVCRDGKIWPYMVQSKGWFFWHDTGVRCKDFEEAANIISALNSLET